MTVGKAIFYLLNNYSNLTDIVSNRIYPEVAEQDGASPFVVYTIISNSPSDTHSGPSQLDVAQVDVVAYSTSYSECIDIGVHVRAALDRVTGTYNGVNVQSCQYTTELIDFDDYRRSYVITQSYDVRISRTEFEIAQGTPVTGARLGDLYDVTDNATTGQVMIKQANGTWAAGNQGSGTGAVDSVNGQTGTVVLDADDISDASTSNKWTTQAEIDKLAGIEAGAQVNTVSSVNGSTGAITGLATTTYVDTEVGSEESARITADASLQTQITTATGNIATNAADIAALEAANYVNTFNGLSGAVTISAGSNITLTQVSNDIEISSSGGGGGHSFGTIAVSGQSDVVADSGNDTLNISAGNGVSLTTNATTDTLDIAVDATTTEIPEGNNLYHTTARVQAVIASASVTNLSDVTSAGSGAIITSAERTKLIGIEDGAEVNVNADWNAVSGDAQILNKPTLATVATSGAYADLSGTPTIPAQFFAVSSNANTAITLNTGDEGRYIRCTASSAVTITVPADKFQVNDEIIIEQAGTGQVTISAGASVTLNNSAANTTKTAERYSVVALKCVASNTFTLTGERELV